MSLWEDKAEAWVQTFEAAAGVSLSGGVTNSQRPGFIVVVIKIDGGFVYKVNAQITTRQKVVDLYAGKAFEP